ncbi:hypothetical protein AcV5_001386 [Taiwanofungus camphoratus]|nr:hypothetical protein AcV5_001386 [Antrodia cinnamomea]
MLENTGPSTSAAKWLVRTAFLMEVTSNASRFRGGRSNTLTRRCIPGRRSNSYTDPGGIIPRPPPQSPERARISATSHDKGKKRAAAEPAETQPAMPPAKRTRTDQPAHAPAVQTGGAVKMEAEADVKPAIAPQGENVDLAAIKRQLQALPSNIEQIESGHQQASVGPRVKQEAIETKARQSAAVVIDLTDD